MALSGAWDEGMAEILLTVRPKSDNRNPKLETLHHHHP